MKLFLLGAGGQLGRAVMSAYAHDTTWQILPFTRCQLDITDVAACRMAIQAYRPDVIVNCAAYTYVDQCELEPETAMRINAWATGELAKLSDEVNAMFVHFSSDYVFDGAERTPYLETDACNPINVYGKSKLAGELAAAIYPRHLILRTAWLYGDGKNFVDTMMRMAKQGQSLRVVYDQWGCPTSAEQVANILRFGLKNGLCGLYHAVCQGHTSWYGLAKTVFDELDWDVTVTPITSDQLSRRAARPTYTVMDVDQLKSAGYTPAHWKDELHKYLYKTDFLIKQSRISTSI